jgi:hypothetical protein
VKRPLYPPCITKWILSISNEMERIQILTILALFGSNGLTLGPKASNSFQYLKNTS